MSEISACYEIILDRMDGSIPDTIVGESDSFVKNFLYLLEAGLAGASRSIVNVTGASVSTSGFSSGYSATQFGYPTRTIGIGSGNTAVTADDYSLSEAFGEGDVRYHPITDPLTSMITPVVPGDGYIYSTICIRRFQNISENQLTIRELGLYARSGSYDILILRDVVEDVAFPAGAVANVKYTLKTEI